MGCCPAKTLKSSKNPLENDHLQTDQNPAKQPSPRLNQSHSKLPSSSSVNPVSEIQSTQIPSEQPKKKTLKITPSHFTIYNDQKLENSYEILQKLGEGFYGYVRLGVQKSSKLNRAIKSIEKFRFTQSSTDSSPFRKEFEILRSLDHPNIVQVFECFEDSWYIHLVTEYIAGGYLIDYIISNRFFSEEMAANIMRQVFSGVSYCHKQQITHRDLQPSNLLMESSNPLTIKLIGFGNSSLMSQLLSCDFRQSNISFSSPEALLSNSFDPKCDSWSCGVILFVLLTGKLPFYGKTEQDLRSRVVQGEFSMKSPSWAKISDEAKDLLRGLLRVDITKRLSIQEAMVHPWLQSGTQATFDILNLKKLSNFRFGQKFQQAVSMFIASQLVSKETLVKLSVEFRNLDQDGDGKISREELLTAYSKIMNRTQALEEVDKVMKKIDLNESGFIDYSEFITACLKTETIANQENLVLAFERFDADGNGKLTVEELKKLLGSGLADLEEVQKIVKEVDLNGDGEIDLKEFQGMMFRQFSP